MTGWQWVKSVWDIIEVAATLVVVVGAIYAFCLWVSGVLPVLFRLGNLKRRRIAVFAKGDAAQSLVALFVDVGLFKRANIIPITSVADLGRAERATVYVVHWPDWSDHLEQILTQKADQTPLIVYAPASHGPLPEPALLILDQHRNAVLTNYRGRLLNDVVTSFITTAYEKG